MVRRRGFLAGVGCAAVCATAAEDGAVKQKRKRRPRVPVLPPGAGERESFLSKCIACSLCVSRCPHQALVASSLEYGLRGVSAPRLDFAKGFCDWDCHTCTKICPTGALSALSHGIKRRMKIGEAHWVRHHCVSVCDDSSCGLCSRNCPTQAITMKKESSGREVPSIDAAKCIGCGTCEYFCPAKHKAIIVQGIARQEFVFGSDTFVAELQSRTIWSSQERGIRPLLLAIGQKVDMAGATCFDRLVGMAAAFLFVKMKIGSISAPVFSKGAVELLKRYGIAFDAGEIVPEIRNRANTGVCPMEQTVQKIENTDVEGAYQALVEADSRLNQPMQGSN